MRLGLIARADSRGLGVQTKAVFDNLHPHKTMVVDCPSMKPLPIRRDWFPGATWIKGLPTTRDFRTWLQGLDVVYTAETGYGTALWEEAQRAGVKTVLHVNPEFLDRKDRPTLWAAPSLWLWDQLPDPKQHLPVPITLGSESKADSCSHFLHVIGRPAVHDRNGSADLLKALAFVESQITVTVRCQEPGYVNSLVRQHNIRTPPNVTLVINSGDVADNAELYRGMDVLVLPRRFGGLCLPVNEALGCGMPVIMPDISPNSDWLPSEWLVPAGWKTSFVAKQRVDVYGVNPKTLAAKIDLFASDGEFFKSAQKQARELAASLSWDALRGRYIETFEGLT